VETQVDEARQIVDVRPAYPAQARQRKVEGWVELELALSASGEVVGVEVVRSEPTRIFDREAVRAAQRWRFEPRKENGVPVATRVRKTVTFRLGS
jgi:protein TonB